MEREEEKKGLSSNKARGDIGDPRIHQGAQTAWSLYHGVLMYDQHTNASRLFRALIHLHCDSSLEKLLGYTL